MDFLYNKTWNEINQSWDDTRDIEYWDKTAITYSENIGLADATFKKPKIPLLDSVSLTDTTIIKSVLKVLSDSITLLDEISSKRIGKVLSDSITLSDIIRYWEEKSNIGMLVDWTEEGKPSSSWTEEAKPTTSWEEEE